MQSHDLVFNIAAHMDGFETVYLALLNFLKGYQLKHNGECNAILTNQFFGHHFIASLVACRLASSKYVRMTSQLAKQGTSQSFMQCAKVVTGSLVEFCLAKQVVKLKHFHES